MRSQYSIGYTPLNDIKDGSYRKLDVKLANKDSRRRRARATTPSSPKPASRPS